MREILFRGKRTDTGEWIEGYFCKTRIEDTCYIARSEGGVCCNEYFRDYEVISDTVGQFTSLCDKNRKRIYEGDIIKSCEYDDIYFVKYFSDEKYAAFDVVPEINVECNGLSHLYFAEGIEVIGNIHDNPDLLEVKDDE